MRGHAKFTLQHVQFLLPCGAGLVLCFRIITETHVVRCVMVLLGVIENFGSV